MQAHHLLYATSKRWVCTICKHIMCPKSVCVTEPLMINLTKELTNISSKIQTFYFAYKITNINNKDSKISSLDFCVKTLHNFNTNMAYKHNFLCKMYLRCSFSLMNSDIQPRHIQHT